MLEKALGEGVRGRKKEVASGGIIEKLLQLT